MSRVERFEQLQPVPVRVVGFTDQAADVRPLGRRDGCFRVGHRIEGDAIDLGQGIAKGRFGATSIQNVGQAAVYTPDLYSEPKKSCV